MNDVMHVQNDEFTTTNSYKEVFENMQKSTKVCSINSYKEVFENMQALFCPP